MGKHTLASSQDALERQYPSLDSSLIAAIRSELNLHVTTELEELHETLGSLCPVDEIQSALDRVSLTSGSGCGCDPFNESSSSRASSTDRSPASFSTPLGFLQNLFPHIDSSTLQSALDEHGADNLEPIIDALLSNDLIRELHERGEWADIDGSVDQTLAPDTVEEWTRVSKANRTTTSRRKAQGKNKQPALVIGDVRHRQVAPSRSTPSVDRWTFVDSVAARLGSILPTVPSTVFSSAFHNPVYSSPASALRSTLANLGSSHTVDDFALASLLSLVDAGPDDVPDARVCLCATASQRDEAYHVFEILKELDEQVPVVAHCSPGRQVVRCAPPDVPAARRKSTAVGASAVAASPRAAPVAGPNEWRSAGETRSAADEHDAGECLAEAVYWNERRHGALKQASELCSRRKHEWGGEGALYYSNLAKEYAGKEREWRLKAAKARVRERQDKSCSNAIDLHGLTVHESLEVVKERVNAWWCSAGSSSTRNDPLQIITGQGRHSKGKVPVIAPAVVKLLERDGWRAHRRGGIVYVTGAARPGR